VRRVSPVRKLTVALASVLATLLVFEGALSLFAGRSLKRFGRRSWYEELALDDAVARETRRATGRTVGPFRVPEDPWVGFTLARETEVEFLEERVTTDALGLRARVGPPRGTDGFHVVLLGDSVAYGHGLPAEQALGPRLEQRLRERRAPLEPELCVTTVALPGWNHWNSTRHLLDHLDALAPDLVLFVPVYNDLEDTYGVSEIGHRRVRSDPCSSLPLANASAPLGLFREMARRAHGLAALRLFGAEDSGQWRMKSGLSAISRARIDAMVANLALLSRRLERRGARLALAPFQQDDLSRSVRAGLLARGVRLPEAAMLDKLLSEDGQGKDPHPSAETTEAMALWLAQNLCAAGLVPRGASGPWPEVPERLRGRAGVALTDEEVPAWRAEFERREAASLSARIEPEAVLGINQIYAGVLGDGSLAPQAAFVLPGGRSLEVELAASLDEPGLYPLVFELLVEGSARGQLTLAHAEDRQVVTLELDAQEQRRPIELVLRAADWGVARVGRFSSPVAARFLRVETRP
jgi:hypothetical protein